MNLGLLIGGFVSDLVTLMLGGGDDAESAREQLKEKIGVIKNIANDFKKSGEKN